MHYDVSIQGFSSPCMDHTTPHGSPRRRYVPQQWTIEVSYSILIHLVFLRGLTFPEKRKVSSDDSDDGILVMCDTRSRRLT